VSDNLFLPAGGVTVQVYVSDLPAAIDWYVETLGFRLLYSIDDIGWAELATGVPGVALGLQVADPLPPGRGLSITFTVKSVAKARVELESRGITFTQPNREVGGMVVLGYFEDPWRNPLCIVENVS
jgi:catechol 2,3-dioxygenase-like lactoylglutathione lyase family enzyme